MIVIIGNGISGVTAARNIRKNSEVPITIISSESTYFFSRTALMYVYMGHMKFEHTQPYEPDFWRENKIELMKTRIDRVDPQKQTLITEHGKTIRYTSLILATGSKPNKFGWKGQNACRVQGLYSKQDLEQMERDTRDAKSAVIIGGGLIGIEMAEMLLSRNIEVHFLVREKYFWNSVLPRVDALFIMRHFEKHHGLHMHYETELEEIQTNDQDEAIGILTTNGEHIACQFVGLTAGVSPNIEFLRTSGIELNRGILVNEYLETSEPHIYAIGDCAEFRVPIEGRRPIEQVWYTGKFMGETIAKTLTGLRTPYTPGFWFNSAKFFDIEYQTYGTVTNQLEPNQAEFVYTHNQQELLLHFVFEKETRKFIGVNAFGIRLRHLLFNEWLMREANMEEVLTHLASANFDPELYQRHEKEILEQFNHQFGTSIRAEERTKWWQKLIRHRALF